MSARQIIGAAILAAPFVGLFACMVAVAGLGTTLAALGMIFGVTGIIFLGCHLLVEG